MLHGRAEVGRLLECRHVPFCLRLRWGFLVTEGVGEGEALARTWPAISPVLQRRGDDVLVVRLYDQRRESIEEE
jgi:hypothetical protein